ncbi:AraC family transcriptional regulator [Kushneria phosphatilytica]|uniref:AraC family transcriptional regulator n=1 Tax=Kushneria phosphatilytica TaxID=657387 RepID=A0A1S1P001_9GAMM|nr:AraC family transcriptional regulator [Kushneria phosphatilytica]OHV13870.1 hypothetical protein BH688_00520 [Kushneria phosphatilytica]QEL10423.1 AraC family transcriptional regulator [Kushneria phosphatilytica]
MFTVSYSLVRLVEEMLRAEGLNRAELLQQAGLPDDPFTGRVGCRLRDFAQLLNLAAVRRRNPAFGLKVYGRTRPDSYGVVGYAMLSSPTLKAAMERFTRFHPLIVTGLNVSLTTVDQLSCLQFEACSEKDGLPYQFFDFEIAALMFYLRWLCDDLQFRPIQAEFMHAEPIYAAPYRRLLQCHLNFGAPRYALIFERATLERPLSFADDALARVHEALAEQRLNELGSRLSAWRVQQLIMSRLSSGEPGIEDIAESLCVSKRTLQRCLKREGALYKDLLNAARRDQAHFFLCHSHITLQEVAYRLGFHEHSSFFRACSRWFGMTPGQYRAHHRRLREQQEKESSTVRVFRLPVRDANEENATTYGRGILTRQ